MIKIFVSTLAISVLALTVLNGQAQSALPSAPSESSRPSSSGPSGSSGSLSSIPEGFNKALISPGFLLSLTVYDTPEMSGTFRVNDTGDIVLPLIGPVHVGGLSVADAQPLLQTTFQKKEILTNPQVNLNVVEYSAAHIAVTGEVAKPGRIEMLAPRSIADVITEAGGTTDLASGTVLLQHQRPTGTVTTSYRYVKGEENMTARSVMVQDGDTVIMPRTGIVYVLGAVQRPGGYPMQDNGSLNVVQALSVALGASRDAKVGGMRVVRRDVGGHPQDIPVDYRSLVAGKEQPLVLMPNDIVYVPVSRLKTVFMTSESLIGQAASTTVYAIR